MLAEASFTGMVKQGEAFNFGPSNLDFQTVSKLVSTLNDLASEADFSKVETTHGPKSFAESEVLTLNSDKALNTFGWRPAAEFQNSVRLTAEWEITHLNGGDLNLISETQIRKFLNV